MKRLLITSGAHVESELASEFGRIPPAFVPVGNRRLYTYRIRPLHADDPRRQRALMANGIRLYLE